MSKGTGIPCGGSHISAAKTCRVGGGALPSPGNYGPEEKKKVAERISSGKFVEPFQPPKEWNDSSGVLEATQEIVGLRGQKGVKMKNGEITVDPKVKISAKAKELIDQYNKLDPVMKEGGAGLVNSGLNIFNGPRDDVPKDDIRGLVNYVAAMRQHATVENGLITTYRDPLTGDTYPFVGPKLVKYGGKVTEKGVAVLASMDHWDKPFGIYGPESEGDPRNVRFLPVGSNSQKGAMSPGRFALKAKMELEGKPFKSSKESPVKDRWGVKPDQDFLPKGITRETELAAFARYKPWAVAQGSKRWQYMIDRYQKKIQKGTATPDEMIAYFAYKAGRMKQHYGFGGDGPWDSHVGRFTAPSKKLNKSSGMQHFISQYEKMNPAEKSQVLQALLGVS
jgi:hypothetical protein